jgi:hypothetical protein
MKDNSSNIIHFDCCDEISYSVRLQKGRQVLDELLKALPLTQRNFSNHYSRELHRNCLLKHVIEENIEGKTRIRT